MSGVLNVRDPYAVDGAVYPGAIGDGCANDGPAIQYWLDQLFRLGAQPVGGCWPGYAAALYFPAGIYRITVPLNVPYLVNVRLFGDVSGTGVSTQDAPTGSFIQQDTSGKPILVFGDVTQAPQADFYGSGWTVENLGFTWADQQDAPAGWTVADGSAACTEPGAVAILFTGPKVTNAQGTTYYNADHYLGRIVGCAFEKGWRGIAIDDRDRAGRKIAVWDTTIEKCRFSSFRGAAISYVNGPGGAIGMPNNSIIDTFVENYSASVGINTHYNIDYQIRISANLMRMTNVGLEGSKYDILYADSSTLTIDNLHIENIHVEKLYGKLIYFGGGCYTIRGLDLDGTMVAWDPDEPRDPKDPDHPRPAGLSTIISADVETEVVLSGVMVRPHPLEDQDPDRGGFIPLVGDAYLLQGSEAPGRRPSAFHLLDRPIMPIFSDATRADWVGPPQDPLTGDATAPPVAESDAPQNLLGPPVPGKYGLSPYKALSLYPDVHGSTPMAPLVQMPPLKRNVTVTTPALAAGARSAIDKPFAGSRVGDFVQVAVPGTVPNQLTVTGVAQTDGVRLWFSNPTGPTAGAVTSVTLLIEIGGGPLAGGPQTLTP